MIVKAQTGRDSIRGYSTAALFIDECVSPEPDSVPLEKVRQAISAQDIPKSVPSMTGKQLKKQAKKMKGPRKVVKELTRDYKECKKIFEVNDGSHKAFYSDFTFWVMLWDDFSGAAYQSFGHWKVVDGKVCSTQRFFGLESFTPFSGEVQNRYLQYLNRAITA